jgi:hypothetical protein
MTDREAFKFGFLLRCADEHLSPEQIRERVKLAYGPALGAAATAGKLGLGALGLGIPLAALGGAGVGYVGAKITDPPVDPDEAKKQELIAAYRQQADRARRTAARVGYRLQHQRPSVPRLPRLAA